MEELKNLDWPEILSQLQKCATSATAKEHLLSLQPLSSPELAKESFNEIISSLSILNLGVRPHFESLDFISAWLIRLEKGSVLSTTELKDVRRFCLEAIALEETLNQISDNQWLTSIKKELMDAGRPLSAIDSIIAANGDIRTDASETLYRLYREKENLTRSLQSLLDRLSKDFDLDTVLQERFVTTREGRWVLPVKSGKQHSFKGIIHASSQSKQTVFMEPEEVVPINNRLRQVEIEIDAEVERLLAQLTQYLRSHVSDFKSSKEILLKMDMRLAAAQLTLKIDAHPVEFDSSQLKLNYVRHPLLVLREEKVIANSIELSIDKKRLLLLSGPNAGGKTVLLKAVGLAAQMARCGLPVCCDENSKLPFFKKLIVSVGDSQSVDAQLSTFAAHLKILDSATSINGSDYLLLIDEICGSTDPEEGSALARSFISQYEQNEVFGVITSHLGPLKSGWDENSGVINGSLEYDNQMGRPTYQFIMGISGQSLALQTAKRIGVKQSIIDNAVVFLSPATKARFNGLEEIETMKVEIRNLRDSLEKEKKDTQKQKSKYELMMTEFEKEKNQRIEKAISKAERELKDILTKANVDQTFRKHETLEKIRAQMPTIVKSPTISMDNKPIESAEEFSKRFPPGSKIYVPSLGQDGIIQGTPNAKGELPILSNSIRLTLSWKDLRAPQLFSNPTAKLVRQSSVGVTVSLQEPQKILDVRGFTVDDAIEHLENYLDQAMLQREDRIKIIHGHGTETLKKAIRGYLSRSLYVKKWQAGSKETGGDGVTWAELADTK